MTSSMTTHNIAVDFKHFPLLFFIFFNIIPASVSALSCSRDRWTQDYLSDFRQRLDGRADALGGRVREKHARHKEEVRLIEQWAWHGSASHCVHACVPACLHACMRARACVCLCDVQ